MIEESILNSYDDAKLLDRIYRIIVTELNNFKDIYDEQENGYNYLAGDQYEHEIKEWWETQLRPTRAFNLTFPVFNRVLGDFLVNDDPMRTFPLPGGSRRTAKDIELLLDHINSPNENDSKTVIGRWALGGLIMRGYVLPRYSDERHLDGSLVFSDVDEFEVLFDHRAKDYFLDDARYMARSRWMDSDDLYHYWPQHKEKLSKLIKERDRDELWTSLTEAEVMMFDDMDFSNEKEGKYRVVEFHEKVYEKSEVAYNTKTGYAEPFSLEGKKADVYLRLNPDMKIITRNNVPIKNITTVMPGLSFILDNTHRADLQDGSYDMVAFSAYNYGRYAINNFGIFRNAKEVQDSFNEWRNEAEAAAKKEADPQTIGDKSKLDNWQDIENFGRMPGLRMWTKDGANIDEALKGLETTPRTQQTASSKAIEMMLMDAEFLHKVLGITPNLEGMAENAQENASLYAQKVRQAKISLEVMYHNFSKSKTRLYNKIIRIAQENYTTERHFLITKPDITTGQYAQQELVLNKKSGNKILNDMTIGRYQAFASTVEHNPTARALRFMQKREVAALIAEWFGPAAIPPEWLLGESDLGDIDVVIARIYEVLKAQSAQAQQDEALGVTDALQNLTQKQLAMLQPDSPKGPGEKN